MGNKYYRHPKFGHVYGSELTSPVGRVCWPALIEPKDPPPPMEGQAPGQPRYEITLLLPKDAEATTKFMAEVKPMVDGMLVTFNEKAKAKLAELNLFPDGDTFDKEKYPYYANNWILSGRNAQQPQVFGKDGKKLEDMTIIKGGVKGRMVVTPIITTHGVSYKIGAFQFASDDGTRYGGGVRDMGSLLDALPDEDEAATMAEVSTNGNLEAAPAEKKGKRAAIDAI